MRILFVLMLCAATPALAVAKGGKLYIKSKDTKVQKEPREKAQAILTLQPGTEVTWLGVSPKDTLWHEVDSGGKKGFVRRSDLTPAKPQAELDASTGYPISREAFANSGAAVTKCSFGSITTKNYSPTEQTTAAELIYVEELNNTKATPAAIEAKNKELHR